MKLPCIITLLLLSSGCTQDRQPTWEPMLDGGNHVGANDVSILAFVYNENADRSIVFYFPFETNSASDHTSNAASRNFDYSGVVTRSPNKEAVLDYHIASTDETKIRCNGTGYELRDGTAFHVAPDGTISQLPFAGLQPTKEYASDLKDYFAKFHAAAIEASE